MVLFEYFKSKTDKSPCIIHCKGKGETLDEPEGFILCSKSTKKDKIYHRSWSNSKGDISLHIQFVYPESWRYWMYLCKKSDLLCHRYGTVDDIDLLNDIANNMRDNTSEVCELY